MTGIQHVTNLLHAAAQPDAKLKAEEIQAGWADFGRMVADNLLHPDLIEVLNRASLKSKGSTRTMAGYIRAFILTGAKP